MLTDRPTETGRTDDGQIVNTIAHPEHSSGELKIIIESLFANHLKTILYLL